MKKQKQMVKDIVTSGITIGVGSMALGAMGQGTTMQPIMNPLTKGYGVVATAGMGMSVVGLMNSEMKKLKKGKK